MRAVVTDTIMRDTPSARALAEATLDFPDERDVPVAVDLATPLAGLDGECRESIALGIDRA